MSESQSRYSIFERLTQKKLDIITTKSELDDNLNSKEQKVEELKKSLKDWETDIKQNIERERRTKQMEIDSLERSFNHIVKRKDSKIKAYDDKLEAIEKALSRIEEISKTAPTS